MAIRIRTFRISSLLLLVALIAVALSWYAANQSLLRFENELLAELDSELGPIHIRNDSRKISVRFGFDPPSAIREPTNLLNRIASGIFPDVFQRITQIKIGEGIEYDNKILATLTRFPHLRQLDLSVAEFSPTGIEGFRESRPDVTILQQVQR